MNRDGLYLKSMAFILLMMACYVFSTGANSAGTPFQLAPIQIDVRNKAKLQRGAQLYMNYCSGCHSLRFMRYNKMAKDLGLTTFDGEVDKNLLQANLVFTKAKLHDPIQIAMPPEEAEQWFGITPPDLSLSARERGAAWIYTYLKSFYQDSSRPFGANNLLVPDVAMPNVLYPLQGKVIAVDDKKKGHGDSNQHLILIENGMMGQQQFDSALEDLVTFLVYVSEPAQLVRYRIGYFVMLFLLLLAGVTYFLKRTYWRNVH